jgi:hypothetical protein
MVCNWVPGWFEPRDSHGGDQIPVRIITAGSGVARVEEGRCGDGGSTENRAGVARSRGSSGIPAARVQEGGKEVARKLPRIDVVLVVSSMRAKKGQSGGTKVRPSGGGEPDCRHGVLLA